MPARRPAGPPALVTDQELQHFLASREAAVREADSLSRPDGWKPKEHALEPVKPKRPNLAKLAKATQAAKKVVSENAPEDTTWRVVSDSGISEGDWRAAVAVVVGAGGGAARQPQMLA